MSPRGGVFYVVRVIGGGYGVKRSEMTLNTHGKHDEEDVTKYRGGC